MRKSIITEEKRKIRKVSSSRITTTAKKKKINHLIGGPMIKTWD
jgi:hypothetical protein